MKRLLARNVRAAALCAGLLCCAGPDAATCAPPNLVHIVFSDVTPGIQTEAFAAQPKSLYRIGSDKMRMEEAADPTNGIHGVIVVAEPNIWMANLYDNSGKHIVDPGPSLLAKAPVFGQVHPGKLAGLEFGCEADFVAANAPKAVRTEEVVDSRFDVYRIEDGADAVEILEQPGTSTPALARYYHEGKLLYVLHYDLYSVGLANDPNLFLPPSGVKYVEPSHP